MEGWYVGLALDHYRCWTIYVPSTGGTRHAETVVFFPHKYDLPIMTPDEVLCETVDKLTQQLATPQHKDLTKFGEDKLDALQKLTQILTPNTKLAVPRVEKIVKI